jgi:hypothetical protein
MPVLPGFLASHPDIRVDMIVDDNLTDIVADRIDTGIRFGDRQRARACCGYQGQRQRRLDAPGFGRGQYSAKCDAFIAQIRNSPDLQNSS